MKPPVTIEITDWELARKLEGRVLAGRHFVFAEALDAAGIESGRKARLRLRGSERRLRVIPIMTEPIELRGLTLNPAAERPRPLAVVVPDRDLYRAEEDTARLFVVLPSEPAGARLVVECDEQPFAERDLTLRHGCAVVTLAALLPGRYEARIATQSERLGAKTEFTVAEYALAPLSARLLEHSAEAERLSFRLAVESWQQATHETLDVSLLDDARPVASTTLGPESPGRYNGVLPMEGDGPFRLSIRVQGDPSRIATVSIPGTRRTERKVTVLSELGQEMLFSLMPEPEAIPARGGYISSGDRLTTPLTVDDVITNAPAIDVHVAADDVHLLVFDLVDGSAQVVEHGEARPGDKIAVETPSGLSLVVVGGLVDGAPFEGFTTFLRPGRLEIEVSAPAVVRPHEDITISIETRPAGPVPVFLTLRDRRLTVTDRPSSSLGASLKRAVDAATDGMGDSGIEPLTFAPRPLPLVMMSMMAGEGELDLMMSQPAAAGEGVGILEELDRSLEDPLDVEHADEGGPGAPRTEFPPVLYSGLLEVDGRVELKVPSGDGLGTFSVEAFAFHDGDWEAVSRDLLVDQPVRADLELPAAARAGDDVEGTLRVATPSGRARVRLTHDGSAVALRTHDGSDLAEEVYTPAFLTFPVTPGTYRALVEDAESGEVDEVEAVVAEPGRMRTLARQLVLLREGETLTLEDAGALSLQVLPGLDEPFELLLDTTASYAHLCCEQTAAKILSAAAMYLSGQDEGKRAQAESTIRKGIAREERMFQPGAGFLMYPNASSFSDHYSRIAARHLWSLDQLAELPGIPSGLRTAAERGIEMADDAGTFHGLQKAPEEPRTLEEAYATMTRGGNASRALSLIEHEVDFSSGRARVRNGTHAVARRAGLAYAAAGLLAAGQLTRGVMAANAVVAEFDEKGGLYSTVDSAAAIALLVQLRLRFVLSDGARVRVNGQEMALAAAIHLGDRAESVEAVQGTVAVQAIAVREEDWDEYGAAFGVRVGLRVGEGRARVGLEPGQGVELRVALEDGYQVGDLVHVHLPHCLSWVHGGGLVKRFSVDFEGRDEVRVPLAVTGAAPGGQHFAVCVRNMFEEERRASPGLMRVETTRPGVVRQRAT